MTTRLQKEISLTLVSIIASSFFFFTLILALAASPPHFGLISGAVLMAFVWIAAAGIALAVAEHTAVVATVSSAALVAAMAAGRLSWGAIGGGLLLALFCGAANQTFVRSRHKFRFYRTSDTFRAGTRLLITGIILASVGTALPFIQNSLARDGLGITPQQAELFLRPLQPFLKDLLPNVTPTSSVDDIIDAQLRQQGIDPAQFTPQQRAQVRRQIADQLALTADSGDTSLSAIVAERINKLIANVTQANALIISLVAVVLIFLTLRAFIPLLTWVAVAFIMGIVWVGNKSSFFSIKKETIEVETLTL